MAVNNTALTNNAWEAFEIKYADKKGSVPGNEAIQIHFPDKPSKKICEALSQVGYSFRSNGTKYWFAYITPAIEKWTLGTLLAKYAPLGARITAAKVGETKIEHQQVGGTNLVTPTSSKVSINDLVLLMRDVFAVVKDVQQQTDATREDICEIRSFLSTYKNQDCIEGLREDLVCKDSEILDLKDKLNVASDLVIDVRSSQSKKDSQIASLVEEMKKSENIIAITLAENVGLRDENAELKKDITNLKETLAERAGSVKKLIAEKTALQKERDVLDDKQAEMQDNIVLLEATIATLRSQIEEWGFRDEQLIDDLPTLEDEEEFPSLENDDELSIPAAEEEVDVSIQVEDDEEVIDRWDQFDEEEDSKNV